MGRSRPPWNRQILQERQLSSSSDALESMANEAIQDVECLETRRYETMKTGQREKGNMLCESDEGVVIGIRQE